MAHADSDAASGRRRRAGCLRDGMWRQRGRGAHKERRNDGTHGSSARAESWRHECVRARDPVFQAEETTGSDRQRQRMLAWAWVGKGGRGEWEGGAFHWKERTAGSPCSQRDRPPAPSAWHCIEGSRHQKRSSPSHSTHPPPVTSALKTNRDVSSRRRAGFLQGGVGLVCQIPAACATLAPCPRRRFLAARFRRRLTKNPVL